jgi:hypothetical protein
VYGPLAGPTDDRVPWLDVVVTDCTAFVDEHDICYLPTIRTLNVNHSELFAPSSDLSFILLLRRLGADGVSAPFPANGPFRTNMSRRASSRSARKANLPLPLKPDRLHRLRSSPCYSFIGNRRSSTMKWPSMGGHAENSHNSPYRPRHRRRDHPTRGIDRSRNSSSEPLKRLTPAEGV